MLVIIIQAKLSSLNWDKKPEIKLKDPPNTRFHCKDNFLPDLLINIIPVMLARISANEKIAEFT